MRRSNYLVPTLKEIPAEATAASHRLMLRAGMIKMLSAGIYSYLPYGYRSIKKVIEIIREEMDRINGQELLLPCLTPLEIWDETGRSVEYGDDMFKLKDRKGHRCCLAPTHEEIICSIARNQIRSWRDLPQTWYQIQSKFRDEPRPRGGVLRMRQFLMKDSYSLDRNEDGLDTSYLKHREAYQRIFQYCGLDYFIVGAYSGLMGGSASEEFMFESEAGEDEVARCETCSYAANIEVATSNVDPVPDGDPTTMTEVETPDQRTVEEVSAYLNIPINRLVKTLIYMGPTGLVMALVSGEDELSEAKLTAIVGGPVRPAEGGEVFQKMAAKIGFLGPHGDHDLPIYADLRFQERKGLVTGANRNGYHVTGLEFGRDVHPDEYVDLRKVNEDESCPVCGKSLRIVKSIELGHIFKLGTKYSEAMGATFLDEKGIERPIIMGSYGIGVERILAAAIESSEDENGIRWNSALTPIDVIVIPLNTSDIKVVKYAETVYNTLSNAGFDTMIDDRDVRPGVKMKDADLTGIPVHIVVSQRNIDKGLVEVKNRWTGERSYVKPEEVIEITEHILEACMPDIE